jgi:hypothetical protein
LKLGVTASSLTMVIVELVATSATGVKLTSKVTESPTAIELGPPLLLNTVSPRITLEIVSGA